jgi:hypothetical protein
MELDLPICATCGVQYGAARADCPICLDERQYVGWGGQKWTSLRELQASGRSSVLEEEGPGVVGVGANPPTAIGQRALLVRAPDGRGNVLFDAITYLDEQLFSRIGFRGGISAIAISHPHFYGSMIEFAHAFDAPVYIHARDRAWVARPDDSVIFWNGDTHEIAPGMTLINAGVHFDGGQVLHRADAGGGGTLCSGDIFGVVMDRRWVSFMHSFPNYIPERPRTIRRALELMGPFKFDRIYGAWWHRNVAGDGVAAIRRSADRYFSFALDDARVEPRDPEE